MKKTHELNINRLYNRPCDCECDHDSQQGGGSCELRRIQTTDIEQMWIYNYSSGQQRDVEFAPSIFLGVDDTLTFILNNSNAEIYQAVESGGLSRSYDVFEKKSYQFSAGMTPTTFYFDKIIIKD